MKVMIATDGTSATDRVFEQLGHAFRLPEALTELVVIHVQDTTFTGDDLRVFNLVYANPEAEGLQILDEARLKLGPLADGATFVEATGVPGPELVHQVRERQIDLLIVGRGQDHEHDRALLGSVSGHVAAHAPCTVVVVK